VTTTTTPTTTYGTVHVRETPAPSGSVQDIIRQYDRMPSTYAPDGNPQMYGSSGTTVRTSTRVFDAQGYDQFGYDWAGYDRDGYDRNGYDRSGYDRRGYDVSGRRR
jgi:hypothetical protein